MATDTSKYLFNREMIGFGLELAKLTLHEDSMLRVKDPQASRQDQHVEIQPACSILTLYSQIL